jgi:hypothetical protein
MESLVKVHVHGGEQELAGAYTSAKSPINRKSGYVDDAVDQLPLKIKTLGTAGRQHLQARQDRIPPGPSRGSRPRDPLVTLCCSLHPPAPPSQP